MGPGRGTIRTHLAHSSTVNTFLGEATGSCLVQGEQYYLELKKNCPDIIHHLKPVSWFRFKQMDPHMFDHKGLFTNYVSHIWVV